MAATETIQIPLGTKAPNFSLPNPITGNSLGLLDVKGERGTLVMFICNHCPFVKHVIHELVSLGNDYADQGIGFVAINSNDVVNYPEDHPELMKSWSEELNFPFPYLYDETQETAKAYVAACTPDFMIYNENLESIYRGQLDDSRPGNGKPVNGTDIRNALDYLLAGTKLETIQKPSIGCNIKWKS